MLQTLTFQHQIKAILFVHWQAHWNYIPIESIILIARGKLFVRVDGRGGRWWFGGCVRILIKLYTFLFDIFD